MLATRLRQRAGDAALLIGATMPLAPLTAHAQAEPIVHWSATASFGQRTLGEWSDQGARLLTEKGPLARIGLRARPAAPRWSTFEVEGSLAHGRLDYDGQTQTGVPLATTTRHTEGELALHWLPLATSGWGEPLVSLAWVGNRRAIQPTRAAGGVTETTSLLMPGIGWRTAPFALPGASLRFDVQALWRASTRHELDVDFGGVFDKASFDGGQRRETVLRLRALVSPQWQWALEWRHARQAASAPAPLLRNAATAGTVRQPLLRIDDVSLSLSRSF